MANKGTHIEKMNKRLAAPPSPKHSASTSPSKALVVIAPANKREVLDAYFDQTNPRSMINLLPRFLKDAVIRLPPHYYEMSEEEITQASFKPLSADQKATPSEDGRRLRIAFWDEYDRCQRLGEKGMATENIIAGVCTLGYFAHRFVTTPPLLAWLIRPPAIYLNSLKDIHDLSRRQLLEISSMSPKRGDGTADVKLGELQLKIFQHVDMRIKGAIIQKIDQRSLSVNVELDGESPQGKKIIEQTVPQQLSMTEVESRIKALEEKSHKLQAPMRIETDLMRETSPAVDEER